MFLIPTGTDRDTGRRAVFVPLLIAICTLAFLVGRPGAPLAPLLGAEKLGVAFVGFEWWQLFSYQFLHGGWFHLIFNMFFLAAFGILLEGRLGHLAFLALFLAGGAFAALVQVGIGHLLAPSGDTIPSIGASGSVSALMGMAFALHPNAHVRGIAIPQFVRAETSLRWLMMFAVSLDIVRTLLDWSGAGRSGIATLAHLGGLGFGLALGLAVLALGLVRRDDVDLLFMLRQWKRRRAMRAAMADSGTGGPEGSVAKRVRAEAGVQETEGQRTLRNTIAAAHRERDYALAAQLYAELLQTLPTATLPAPIQLDVANHLAQSGRDRDAAVAYRLFIDRFRSNPACDDARLMLAAIEARRLGDRPAALRTLAGFADRELDADRRALADALIAECGGGAS